MENNAPYSTEERHPVIGEAIDRKYIIRAHNASKENATEHNEYDSVLFLAKDKALPATLEFYRHECERLGATKEQILGIDLLIKRVERFQELNLDMIKVADVELGNEATNVLAENKTWNHSEKTV